MTDITKRLSSTGAWRYEAVLARAKAWMMEHYDAHTVSLSPNDAKQFEHRATKAGFVIAPPVRSAKA